jgi:hypothetical protein
MVADDVPPSRRPGAVPGLRAADTDRDAVAERLRVAAGEGRLSMEEFEERLEAALTARTFADLEPLVADLPAEEAAPERRDEPLVLKAGLSDVRRTGHWVVPSKIIVSTGIGGVRLDFTAAECAHRVVAVEVAIGIGDVVAVVPRGWEAYTDEVVPGLGDVHNRVTGPAEPGSRTLRFTGSVNMGVLRVRHPNRFELARARRAGR